MKIEIDGHKIEGTEADIRRVLEIVLDLKKRQTSEYQNPNMQRPYRPYRQDPFHPYPIDIRPDQRWPKPPLDWRPNAQTYEVTLQQFFPLDGKF